MSKVGNLFSFVKYVWNHGDQLLVLFQALPKGLRAAGTGMETAGNGAVLAGKAFGGASAEEANAADVLQSAANAVEECHLQVQAVARDIRGLADALDRVKVPTVTPVKQHFNLRVFGLGEHDLVTGITLNEQGASLFGNVTSNMRAQANSMETNLGGQLHAASESLSSMSRTLDGAGDSLTSLGNSLKDGGAALEQLEQFSIE